MSKTTKKQPETPTAAPQSSPAAMTPATAQPVRDLVDAIFVLLVSEHPELARLNLADLKRLAREEFGGEKAYVRMPQEADERQRAQLDQVLSLFNGRNASEIARKLGIGRATVYRLLKRARRAKMEKVSHAFP